MFYRTARSKGVVVLKNPFRTKTYASSFAKKIDLLRTKSPQGIQKVQESVDALRQSLNDRINLIEEGQRKLGKKVVTLEGNLKVNSDKIKALEKHSPGDEFILDEVEERLARRSNVLLFNLPESTQTDLKARSEADSDF
ncbi:hypothetical protein KQX54_017580, partial [Cotesia glomerata]